MRGLSKEEFVQRVMADLAKKKAVSQQPVQAVAEKPKLKRKCIYKRTKHKYFEIVERTVLYV